MKAELLRELCFHTGTVADMTMRVQLDEQLDPLELQRNARWRRAYLGRYLRFSPSEVDAMSRRESHAYIGLVAELLKAEAGKVETTFENL